MAFGLIWYTILCVSINEVIFGGGSNLMTEEDIKNLTPKTHAERVRGSKWVFVSEHAMQLTIWSCKGCMLVIYARMTSGLSKKRLVNYLSVYVVLGFIGSELALFLTCIPIQNYWAVPTPKCASPTVVIIEDLILTTVQTNAPVTNIMKSSRVPSLSVQILRCWRSRFPSSLAFTFR